MVAVVQDTAAGFQSGELTAGRSLRQIIWSRLRRDRIAMICLVILIVYYLLAIFGAAPDAGAKGPPCEKADQKLAATGRGDSDHDGIPDAIEPLLGLDPFNADSLGDGVSDGDRDFDHDGLSNAAEIITYASGVNVMP